MAHDIDEAKQRAEMAGTMQRIGLLANVAASMPADEVAAVLAALERAETLGPMLDPTAWIRGHKFETVHANRRVIEAFDRFRAVAAEELAKAEGRT
jgi:hypothetical protein